MEVLCPAAAPLAGVKVTTMGSNDFYIVPHRSAIHLLELCIIISDLTHGRIHCGRKKLLGAALLRRRGCMSIDPLPLLATVIGLLVAGESLALWIGVIVRQPDSPWVTDTVRILLVLDIVSGAALAASADGGVLQVPAAAVILATHAYRVWEYLAGRPDRFCFNLRLFLFNNLKLLGVVGVILFLILSL